MNITRLSAISLAGLALSAGVASASTFEYNESDPDSVDLLGPPPAEGSNIFDIPPEEKANLPFEDNDQFFELGAGEHLRVNGTVGLDDNNPEDLFDLFKFTSSEKFTVSNIDFEFSPGNEGNTGFRLYDEFGELVKGFDLFPDPNPDAPNGTLFEDEFVPGSYILGVFDRSDRQPFHLGVTTHGAPNGPSEVPLPAAAWFLVGGVAALGAAKAGRRRRG